jgi:predicted MFS family arabinose efflux permease
VLNLILLVTVAALFGFAYATLLPAFAQDVLHTDAQGLGWLNAASGIGSLAGALLMASQSKFLTRGRLVTIGSIVFPALLVALALTQVLWLACVLLIGVGFFFMIENTSSNTLVQTVIPDHLRGRVMSVYMMTFFGLSPIGSLQAGIIAEHLGTPAGMGVGAVIALVYGVIILWRVPLVRRLA